MASRVDGQPLRGPSFVVELHGLRAQRAANRPRSAYWIKSASRPQETMKSDSSKEFAGGVTEREERLAT